MSGTSLMIAVFVVLGVYSKARGTAITLVRHGTYDARTTAEHTTAACVRTADRACTGIDGPSLAERERYVTGYGREDRTNRRGARGRSQFRGNGRRTTCYDQSCRISVASWRIYRSISAVVDTSSAHKGLTSRTGITRGRICRPVCAVAIAGPTDHDLPGGTYIASGRISRTIAAITNTTAIDKTLARITSVARWIIVGTVSAG